MGTSSPYLMAACLFLDIYAIMGYNIDWCGDAHDKRSFDII
jgi:hypothetical protein